MKLSVIVLSYNHPQLTARTLSSLRAFSFTDIILVHNGSEKKCQEYLKQEFPDIEHLVLPTNLGYSGGANAGLEMAFQKNDWCLFLTNDCELEKVGLLPKEVSLVCPKIMSRKTERVDSIGGLFIPKKGLLKHCRDEHSFYSSTQLKYAPGTAFLLHKNIYQQIGGFDTKLGTYWEDVDFSQRCLRSGVKITVDGDWVIRHAIGKTCHRHSLYTLYYYQRNRRWVSKRYINSRDSWRLHLRLFIDYVKLAFRLVTKRRYKDLGLLHKAFLEPPP